MEIQWAAERQGKNLSFIAVFSCKEVKTYSTVEDWKVKEKKSYLTKESSLWKTNKWKTSTKFFNGFLAMLLAK